MSDGSEPDDLVEPEEPMSSDAPDEVEEPVADERRRPLGERAHELVRKPAFWAGVVAFVLGVVLSRCVTSGGDDDAAPGVRPSAVPESVVQR